MELYDILRSLADLVPESVCTSIAGGMLQPETSLLALKLVPVSVSLELECASHVSLELECARGRAGEGVGAASEVLELGGVGER